ncbi:MAG: DMT family transporter [Oscillibacter sp.]|nr:DMT family transporter [Oscillibacter sp.]
MKRLIVLLGVAGTSLSAVLVRWSTAPSMVLVLYRMLFASLLLAPAVLLRNRKELKNLDRRDILLCLASGVFLGFHFAAYFSALRYTAIASAVLLVDLEVFFVALCTVLLFRQKLPGAAWIAIVLTFGGSVLVAFADTGIGSDPLRGNVTALAGAFCMAVYTMIGAVCRKRVSTSVYTFLVYTCAALTVLAASLVSGVPLTGHGTVNYLTALGMTVFCTLLGHSVFSWGLKYLPAAFISTVKLMEPVFASVWGLLLFGEVPGWMVVTGGAVIIFGIALYGRAVSDE